MKKLLITIGLISFLLNTPVSHAERLRLYAFYTPSHQVFLDDWFLPSIQDDFDLILECYDQVCKNGDFMKDGWIETMLHSPIKILAYFYSLSKTFLKRKTVQQLISQK